jgi:AAA15 family ATPase/GTPase
VKVKQQKRQISKLAKVNLFLGKNSVGKTALLEAFYIFFVSVCFNGY